MRSDTAATIRAFVTQEFLDPQDVDLLEDGTPLVSSGVIDSLGVIRLVTFVEKRFGIKLRAHEMNAQHLDSIDQIARLVASRTAGG